MTATALLTVEEHSELTELETVIERGLTQFEEVGRALITVREKRLYRSRFGTFEDYCRQRWGMSKPRAYQLMDAASVIANLQTSTRVDVPTVERHARPLAALPPEQQAPAWQRAVETLPPGQPMTAAHVQKTVADVQAYAPPKPSAPVLVEKPSVTSARQDVQPIAAHKAASIPTFNRTNDNVDWAWWTWNPVTGCLHDCPYCYARDIANRFYPQKFVPTFHEDRLDAPRFSKLPASDDPRARRVFTCSMADLFGKWVPQEWIDAVFGQVRDNPQWEFLFLTKFPQRLAELDWPDNAWVGTTVDSQRRVEIAERSFRGVKAGVKWLSCEPMMERLTFTSLEMFDWVVIGGASASSQTPAFTPPSEWVEHLLMQARAAGCKVYFKDNLFYQPKEQPRSGRG